jgi:hypothetical protein
MEQQSLDSNLGLLTASIRAATVPPPLSPKAPPTTTSWSYTSPPPPPLSTWHRESNQSQQPPGPCPCVPRQLGRGKGIDQTLNILNRTFFYFEEEIIDLVQKQNINPWVRFGIQQISTICSGLGFEVLVRSLEGNNMGPIPRAPEASASTIPLLGLGEEKLCRKA